MTTLVIKGKGIVGRLDFSCDSVENKGGANVNEFEQNVQCKRNDAIDAGVAFVVSFGFFATIFIIGTAIKLIGS